MNERITTLTHDGLVFDVLDEGPLDGDVVVLLHGFPERASSWREVSALLHAQGLRTLAPDQRGYSPGARPPRRRDYRITALVDDVVALVDRVGGPVHLVGHDWGAAVAWNVAASRPDLIRSLTALSVPHVAAFLRAAVTSRQGLKSWYMAAFQLPRLPELLRGAPMEKLLTRGGMTAAEVARYRTDVVAYGALPGGISWYRGIPFGDRDLLRRKVTVPTTLVWTEGDAYVHRRSVELTAGWVDAAYDLVVLPGTHWLPTQQPAAVAAAVLRQARA